MRSCASSFQTAISPQLDLMTMPTSQRWLELFDVHYSERIRHTWVDLYSTPRRTGSYQLCKWRNSRSRGCVLTTLACRMSPTYNCSTEIECRITRSQDCRDHHQGSRTPSSADRLESPCPTGNAASLKLLRDLNTGSLRAAKAPLGTSISCHDGRMRT